MRAVHFDIDTQLDFVLPSGALYAPGAEKIIATVGELNKAAARAKVPVISTMDAHAENDPEFLDWPGHCIAGTLGQRKPESTLLGKRLVIPAEEAAERIDGFEQILLEKRHLDCFTNPNLKWLLEVYQAERYVVYGVVTEVCVKFAAFGLLETGKQVEIVEEAICGLVPERARATLEEFRRSGGRTVSVATLV
jgi:nicotinamidase/pyrazinamidase